MPTSCCILSIEVREMGHSSYICNCQSTNRNYKYDNHNFPIKWPYIPRCYIFCVYTSRIWDGGGIALCNSIIHQEEKLGLQKWKDVMTMEYPHFECDIEPYGLTIATLANGKNVMIDG